MRTLIDQLISGEDGQGITEYGAVLAFVAILISGFFHVASGPYAAILDGTYTRISQTLVALIQSIGA